MWRICCLFSGQSSKFKLSITNEPLLLSLPANFESTETCSTSTGVDNEPNIGRVWLFTCSRWVCVFLLEFESLASVLQRLCVHAQSNQCADYCTPVWSWTGSLNTGMDRAGDSSNPLSRLSLFFTSFSLSTSITQSNPAGLDLHRGGRKMQNKQDRNRLHCFYLILIRDDADGRGRRETLQMSVYPFSTFLVPSCPRLPFPALVCSIQPWRGTFAPTAAYWQDVHGRQ